MATIAFEKKGLNLMRKTSQRSKWSPLLGQYEDSTPFRELIRHMPGLHSLLQYQVTVATLILVHWQILQRLYWTAVWWLVSTLITPIVSITQLHTTMSSSMTFTVEKMILEKTSELFYFYLHVCIIFGE